MAASQEKQSGVIDVENFRSSSDSSEDDTGADDRGHVTRDAACCEYAETEGCVCACDEPCKMDATTGREKHGEQECCYGGGKKHPRRRGFGWHGHGFWDHHGKWGHGHGHNGGGHHGGGDHGRRFKRFCHGFGDEPWAVSGDSSDEKFRCKKKFAKKHAMFKALKKSIKEAKKYRKDAKCVSGNGGKCKKDAPKNSFKEDIYVYMGDFMANEVSVTLTEGKVKITGDHCSKNTYCRPHSAVHMFAAPKDAERNLVKAILYPRGMLQVKFLEVTEKPIELPVGDDVTVAGDAIAEMRVDEK